MAVGISAGWLGHEASSKSEHTTTLSLQAGAPPSTMLVGQRSNLLNLSSRLKHILSRLKEDAIDQETLISNLEYVSEVMRAVANKTE